MEPTGNHNDSPAAPGLLGFLSSELTENMVMRLLYNVIDPELGVNIVDLGLVYDVAIDEGAGAVEVEMTLTSPGCPLSGYMDDEIHAQMTQLPQVRNVDVQLVWDPAWGPHMMSDAGRSALGWQ